MARRMCCQEIVMCWRYRALALLALFMNAGGASGAEQEPYLIQAGDILIVSVWKETDLSNEVLVRPDGGISFPLVGNLPAAGRNVDELRTAVEERLRKFIPDPSVTIGVKQIGGNRVYVIGKVNR